MRKVLRIGGTVIGIVGIIALAWALVTVTWKEPFTSYEQSRQQDKLQTQLDREYDKRKVLVSTCASIPTPSPCRVKIAGPPSPKRLPKLREGQAVGRLKADGINTIITYGRQPSSINKGPGMWHARPGYGRTVAISGHRTTHGAPFRKINGLHSGDKITLTTPWGTWRYRVETTRIVKPNDIWVVRNRGYDRLVLTACHPVYSAKQRYVVFAKLIKSGS